MELNYSYIASSLSTDELIDRVNNRQKYMPNSVEAAVKELQFRKHAFSDEELRQMEQDIRTQRENAAQFNGRQQAFSDKKGVTVIDPDAPQLYSLRASRIFTILCGAFFGSILIAININKIGKGINASWAILFGVVFSVVQIVVLNGYTNPGSGSSGAILGGLIASYILDYVFWRNFIGYSTFYRAKPIWVPLIIALVIFSFFAGILYLEYLHLLTIP